MMLTLLVIVGLIVAANAVVLAALAARYHRESQRETTPKRAASVRVLASLR